MLIVDDKALNREILCRRLEHWGMTARAEAAVATALDALRGAARSDLPFDLALIDYRMDEETGRDSSTRFAPTRSLRSTTVVMMVAARDSHTAAAISDVDGVVGEADPAEPAARRARARDEPDVPAALQAGAEPAPAARAPRPRAS